MPVVTSSLEEREILQAQTGYGHLKELVAEASLLMMGIGYWGPEASIYMDGFITGQETRPAMECGAVAELLGCVVDENGNIVDADYHKRLTSFVMRSPVNKPAIIVASGGSRAAAMKAAFKGRLANGLITDENTARLLLE